MASPPLKLTEDLVEFLQSGVSTIVGTVDVDKRPAVVRAVGVTVDASRTSFVVFVPNATAERTIANALATRRIAVTFSRPVDHRTFQCKGRVVDVRAATEGERAIMERYVAGFGGHVEVVGLPRAITERLTYWPSTAIEVAIEDVFVQTPGPSAGMRLVTNEDAS